MSSKKNTSKKSASKPKMVIRDLQPKQDPKGGVNYFIVDAHVDDLTPRRDLAVAYDGNGGALPGVTVT